MDIKVYSDERFGSIRVIDWVGDPWFVVDDICRLFGDKERNRLMQQVASQHKDFHTIDTVDGRQQVSIVNMTGLETLMYGYRTSRPRGISYGELGGWKRYLDDFLDWIRYAAGHAGKEEKQQADVDAHRCDAGDVVQEETATGSTSTSDPPLVIDCPPNGLQVFQDDHFGKIRTMMIDGKPWFFAVDVCDALEIKNPTNALRTLAGDEKMTLHTKKGQPGTRGGAQQYRVVSEPGLYALVSKSRKPEAAAFQRWIHHSVLPSIREHGIYVTDETLVEMITRPESVRIILSKLTDVLTKNLVLEGRVTEMAPKEAYYDRLCDARANSSIRNTAKAFGVNERTFVHHLLDRGYLYRGKDDKLRPYKHHEKNGLFVLKDCFNERNLWSGPQTLITPKGKTILLRELMECGIIVVADDVV